MATRERISIVHGTSGHASSSLGDGGRRAYTICEPLKSNAGLGKLCHTKHSVACITVTA